MKYIQKSSEPRSLAQVKNLKYPRLELTFTNLPPHVVNDIKEHLLMDQGFLCCYTLDEINAENAILVHFDPIDYFPDSALDYKNMYLALRQPDNLPPKYRVGYLSKGNAIIPNYLADIRCSAYFRYNTLGEMIPSNTFRTVKKCHDNFRKLSPEQQTALCTIDLLNLNAERLKDQRKAIHNQIVELARKTNKSKIEGFIRHLQMPNPEGKYRRFREVMIYYLKQTI